MFLPNSHSFLLVKNRSPVIQSDIRESATSLPASLSSNSRRNLFSPNSHSFLLAKSVISKPVIQSGIYESATSLPPPPLADSGKSTIGDKNKRTFLKMAGIAGASLIGSLLLPKKADALIMGSSPTTGVVGVKNATNVRINPATQETVSTLATETTLDKVLKKTDLTFDGDNLQVKVTSVSGEGSSSFSNAAGDAKSGLVDADRHVQVDVLTSALPSTASKDETLQTIAYGGVKFACRLIVKSDDSNIEYLGEAAVGTLTASALWRIKKIDSTSGVVIQWADGNANFDNIFDNRESLSYS